MEVQQPNPLLIPAEDFWSRQHNEQRYSTELAPLGMLATVSCNDENILTTVALSEDRFSRAHSNKIGGQPCSIRIAVREAQAAPLSDDFSRKLVYSGVGSNISISAGEWGHGFADLHTREATIFIAPELAASSGLVSRYFVDHYLLNFLFVDWAMLHASAVYNIERKRLLLFIAPHNTGKSTTALRLLRAGHAFLADGMALLRLTDSGKFIVGGYPIGEVKLRDDMLADFPEYSGPTVSVCEQRKTVVNLRAAHPDQLAEELFEPEQIHLVFMERSSEPNSTTGPLALEDTLKRLGQNTLFWDKADRLESNSNVLGQLAHSAQSQRLIMGTEIAALIRTIEEFE